MECDNKWRKRQGAPPVTPRAPFPPQIVALRDWRSALQSSATNAEPTLRARFARVRTSLQRAEKAKANFKATLPFNSRSTWN